MAHKGKLRPPNQKEVDFCRLIQEHNLTATAAAKEVGFKSSTAGSRLMNRPQVQALLASMRALTIEKVAEQSSEEVVLGLDLADRRLKEVLSAERFDPTRTLLLKIQAEGAAKGKCEMPMLPNGDKPPVDDHALLKAVDLTYKRKGGYPQPSPTGAGLMQQINAGHVDVYQSAWMNQPAPVTPPAEQEKKKPDGNHHSLPAAVSS